MTTTGCRSGSRVRSRCSIAARDRLTQADVPLPWSMCSQIPHPSPPLRPRRVVGRGTLDPVVVDGDDVVEVVPVRPRPPARRREGGGPRVRQPGAGIGQDTARVGEREHADRTAVVACAVLGGPALLAVVPPPAPDALPGRSPSGVEHDGGVRGVLPVAVHRHNLAGNSGDPPLQPVTDPRDAGRPGGARRGPASPAGRPRRTVTPLLHGPTTARGQGREQQAADHRRGPRAPRIAMSHRPMLAPLSGRQRQVPTSGPCRTAVGSGRRQGKPVDFDHAATRTLHGLLPLPADLPARPSAPPPPRLLLRLPVSFSPYP